MNLEPRSSISPLRILYLEDSIADCTLVTEALSAAGLSPEITRVDTEAAYLAALRGARPDLILADYTVPGYDGGAALAAARDYRPATPFIFVSGTIGEERAITILKEGATDYVLKHRIARLVPAVERALREARERDELRKTEESLHASERRFREMAENIREVFWSASANGRHLLYASPAYEQVWQRPLTDLSANPEAWLDAVAPSDRDAVLLARAELAQGRAVNHEYRVTLPDGGVRWIEEHGYPVLDASGRIARTAGVAIDITARKDLEAKLRQAQKMEAIGQLAGGIAHDFSNMLTVINGCSGLLLEHPGLPPAISETLRQIYVAGGRAADLTRQLLLFSRKGEPTRESLDLNEVVTESANLLRRMLGETIRLDLDLARPLPRIVADAGMLDQVLMNLAVNARDAMPRGGALVIGTGSSDLTAADCRRNSHCRPGPCVWLSVRDTGTGIPPEVMPRIFEPFFTTKETGKGTGLGLATVFGIARQHQGWVEVESEPGEGALFRVFLPLAAGPVPAPARAPAPAAQPVRGGRETILIVEDEAMVREYACTVLTRQGYRILQAATGADAVETWKWHREQIALVLSDVVLPDDMTGPQLIAKLRADRPGLPVILASGYDKDSATREDAANRFLRKPYRPELLARLVRETLDHRPLVAARPTPAASIRPSV